MKFISKNANLRIVLKPGVAGNPIAGHPAQAGIYVKFQDGIVKVDKEEEINMMRLHPGYNTDFIEAEETLVDPYASSRKEIEPPHVISEVKYGHVEGKKSSPQKVKISPEMTKLLREQAMAMAKEMVQQMLPTAVEETIKALSEKHKDDKKVEEPKVEAKGKIPEEPIKEASKELEEVTA